MDNLTHTVIGAIAGESLARYLPGRTALAVRRPLYLAAGMIGGNLPDLDLLYSYRGRHSQAGALTYLLEHRGYTHTVLGCLLLGACLALGLLGYARWRGLTLARAETLRLIGVALFATALHLAMDALNSYGVHPFWPFDDRWVYGDAVFIVEPWYWIAAAPLILLAESRHGRAPLIALQLLAVAAACFTGWVPWPVAIALAVASVLLIALARVLPLAWSAALSAFAFACVSAAFLLGSHAASRTLQALAAAELPPGTRLDAVLSPLPADPLCFDALLLSLEGDQYVARRAVIALAPGVLPAGRCRDPAYAALGDAAWSVTPHDDARALRWRTLSVPARAFAVLTREHCEAAALMQFVRAPFLTASAVQTLLGDLRFDRVPGGNFAEVKLHTGASAGACASTPPWVRPRADLLALPPAR